MNNNRDHTDQVVNFLSNDSRKKKELSLPLTEEYYHSEALKEAARNAVEIIGSALGYSKLSGPDFDAYFKTALIEFLSNNPIEIVTSQSLKKSRGTTWLTAERYNDIQWNYTDRYFTFLKRTGRSEKVIEEVYKSSRKILEKMEDPKSGKQFYTKGLVVGSVQSGKTANFNAVINRALDSGYALIIVLSGIMEDLRVQTQGRIEREVSGTDRTGKLHVGMVKKFGEMGDSSVHQVVVPTSLSQDFKKTIKQADFSLNNKNILVCKKNTGVLKNLILWLDDYLTSDREKHDIPFLIVDDEADNASLNNMGKKGKEYASAVNGLIRALLGLFNRKTYLGYTATPFANVLQDRNDAPETRWPVDEKVKGETVRKDFEMVNNIFPDDFIELLFPPSNYIGAKHFFETRTGDIKKIEPLVAPAVTDYNASFPSRVNREDPPVPVSETDEDYPRAKKDDDFPKTLPQSLKDAIQCFIISAAVRLSRKPAMAGSKLYNPHNTMLIHISRFTAWQMRTKTLVEKFVNDDLTVRLNNDLPRDPASVYAEFERTWFKYYAHIIDNIKSYLPDGYEDEFLVPKSFEKDIKPLLVEAIKGIETKAINSETKDTLSYPENSEKKYIAIGGNRLSRGFTLEGLTINYFIRSTDYADTLLQMGRWFGYRPGYIDCCKLFTTTANINKFDLTTLTVEALEQEFDTMSKSNRTPADFVLRVKTHPKVLNITRASIIKKTIEEKVNYSGDIEQSTKFYIDPDKISAAWNDFVNHARKIPWETDDERDFFIYRTNANGLLEFLRLGNTFAGFEIPGLAEYLKLCNIEGKLTDWTIAVKRNSSTKTTIPLSKEKSGLPGDLNLTIRRGPKPGSNARNYLLDDNVFKASGKSAQIVAAGSDFSLTLSDDGKRKAEAVFIEEKIQALINEDKLTRTEAEKKVKGTTIPDKAYRVAMNEKDGILVIYLIDLKRVFESVEGQTDKDLQDYMLGKNLDVTIPLVGYALGFPRVSGDIGGTYVRGDYKLEAISEETEEEFDDALNEENP